MTKEHQVDRSRKSFAHDYVPFGVAVVSMLLSLPAVAEAQVSEQASGEGQAQEVVATVEPMSSVAVGAGQSANVTFALYGREGDPPLVDALPIVVTMELNSPTLPGEIRSLQPIVLDVTPLGRLFRPVVSAIAEGRPVRGVRAEPGGRLSVDTKTTGVHNLVVTAIRAWAETRTEHDRKESPSAEQYREYLQQSHHIISVFADDSIPELQADSIKGYLNTKEINKKHAAARDREHWVAAKESDATMDALDSYLKKFPHGAHVEDAREALATANGACIQAASVRRARFRDCDDCPVMSVIPGGEFMMGSSPTSDPDSEDNERPRHRVTVEGPLAVGTHEVTNIEYYARSRSQQVTCWRHQSDKLDWEESKGSRWLSRDDTSVDGDGQPWEEQVRYPVVCVDWNEASRYADRLSEHLKLLAGERYRLLSEAEWEYAARAGTTTRFYYGDKLEEWMANFLSAQKAERCEQAESANDDSTCSYGVMEVGTFERNAFGLLDMHGNAWEWVLDTWSKDYGEALDDGSVYSGESELHVLRGGSWADEPRYLRSAMRGRSYPEVRTDFTGFRVARSLYGEVQPKCPSGVKLSVAKLEASETDGPSVELHAHLDWEQLSDTRIELNVGGTATFGVDYRMRPESMVIDLPARATSRTLTITLTDDDEAEGSETVVVNGTTDGLRVAGTTLMLNDDDERVELGVKPIKFSEGDDQAVVVVTATLPEGTRTEVTLIALEMVGEAANSIDYAVAPATPTIEIPAGATSGTATLTFRPFEDEANEGSGETIVIAGKASEPGAPAVISTVLMLKERGRRPPAE